MKTATTVIVKLAVDGCHNFPKAAELFPEVDFLADRHRHMFHFTVACKVTHSDRDKEFIMLKRDVIDYLMENTLMTFQELVSLDQSHVKC